MDETLRAAAHRLTSPQRAEREAGESALVAARHAAIPALIDVLEHAARSQAGALPWSPISRAALLVGAMQARAAVPALCLVVREGSLRGDDGAFVARALAEILDGRDAFDDHVRLTLEALSTSPDMYTRAYAAEAFGALGDTRSKGRVQALANDAAPWVRERAQAVLMRLADADAKSAADAVSLADFAALVRDADASGGALRPWLDDLRDDRRTVRDAAVTELVKAGRVAVPHLIDLVNQPHVRARIGAAQALGRLQPPEAAGPLLIAATTTPATPEERELRPIALRALANCLTGQEEGLAPSLMPLAHDRDRFTRAAALLCLGRVADRQGMRAVVAAILEDDPVVVESAAVALSEGIREEDTDLVRPLLVALAKRPSPRLAVREAILIALSRIAIEEPAWRVRARHRVRRELAGGTASMRKAVIVLLERMYSDDDPPPLSIIDDMLGRLDDDHPEVRVVAASFLSRHLEPGFTAAAARLRTAIARQERTLSLLCLEALRRHATDVARHVISSAVRDADSAVSARATELLATTTAVGSEWSFAHRQPRATTPSMSSSSMTPRPASPSRPSRVRPADDGADVVDARDPD